MSIIITISIDDKHLKDLDALVELLDTDRSKLFRKMIRRETERQQSKKRSEKK
jgi:metal-responsive CopG/Arc/MetJ family transcriptional regulator